jgi:ornithine lipid hydroxylase
VTGCNNAVYDRPQTASARYPQSMNLLRVAIGVLTFPVLLGGSVAGVWAGIQAGYDPLALVMVMLVVCSGILLVLQRIHPAVPAWRSWRPQAGLDLAHAWLSSLGSTLAARALVLGGVIHLAERLAESGVTPWPNHWPVLLQLPIAIVLSDLGAYWVHRLSHQWGPMWRLHALHHSSEQLYVLSSGRNHPVHTALTSLLEVAPLVLLGAGPELLALHAAFTAAVGLLQHSNVAMRHGPLSYVLATADLHRWHHSAIEEESKTNFGNNIALWDHVFGTFHLSPGRTPPTAVGIDGLKFPRHLLLHLVSPLILNRFRSEGEPTT